MSILIFVIIILVIIAAIAADARLERKINELEKQLEQK